MPYVPRFQSSIQMLRNRGEQEWSQMEKDIKAYSSGVLERIKQRLQEGCDRYLAKQKDSVVGLFYDFSIGALDQALIRLNSRGSRS